MSAVRRSAVRRSIEDLRTETLYSLTALEIHLRDIRDQIRLHHMMLARIIAKLEPTLVRDEQSQEVRAESDAIAERVIAKMKEEYEASNKWR